MRVFVAGATGVIGRRIVPRLIEAGHTVTAMTRSLDRAKGLAGLGADLVACDVYDAKGLEEVLRKAKPDVVIHQLTALPKAIDPRKMEEQLAPNDRIRTEGTRNLVRAAVLAGTRRIVAQSVSFVYTPEGGPVKDEDAPLWLDAPWPWRRSVEAVAELERQVRSAEGVEGVVLRYGYFYGPGTAYAEDGSVADLVRARQLPVGGGGSGIFSFVHVDDAASATILALEHGRPLWCVLHDRAARCLQRASQEGAWLVTRVPDLADRVHRAMIRASVGVVAAFSRARRRSDRRLTRLRLATKSFDAQQRRKVGSKSVHAQYWI